MAFDCDIADVRIVVEKLGHLVEQIKRFGLDLGLSGLEEYLLLDVDLSIFESDFCIGICIGASVFVFVTVDSFGF